MNEVLPGEIIITVHLNHCAGIHSFVSFFFSFFLNKLSIVNNKLLTRDNLSFHFRFVLKYLPHSQINGLIVGLS